MRTQRKLRYVALVEKKDNVSGNQLVPKLGFTTLIEINNVSKLLAQFIGFVGASIRTKCGGMQTVRYIG